MAESESEFVKLPDEAATEALGRRLAQEAHPGALVALQGELGTGKTALARAMIRKLLGDPAVEVPSPSFSLVQPYAGRHGPILHADLYRLGTEDEVEELGLFDSPEAIVIVEWPERATALLVRADIVVRLVIPPGGAGREAEIRRRIGGRR